MLAGGRQPHQQSVIDQAVDLVASLHEAGSNFHQQLQLLAAHEVVQKGHLPLELLSALHDAGILGLEREQGTQQADFLLQFVQEEAPLSIILVLRGTATIQHLYHGLLTVFIPGQAIVLPELLQHGLPVFHVLLQVHGNIPHPRILALQQ